MNLDAADAGVQQSNSRVLFQEGDVDLETPEEPRVHVDTGLDDEDYSKEGSGMDH